MHVRTARKCYVAPFACIVLCFVNVFSISRSGEQARLKSTIVTLTLSPNPT